jgi:uroporphyrinogen-III decarboxylase
MSSLERITTVLEGKIPDKVPSFCMGGDYDFVDKFMKSPYALTDEDMKQLDKDKVSYAIPFIHSIIAKFSPTEILKGGLDAKIDMCWKFLEKEPPIKLEVINDFIYQNGMILKTVIRENGIPHFWFMGPALLKKEHIEAYWEKQKELRPHESCVRNFARIRETMLKKYDIVVSQGQTGPFENLVNGIGYANIARFSRKDPSFLQQHIDFQWETFEEPTLNMLMNTKPDVVMCGDDYGYNSGLRMPAKDWRNFIKPILANYVKIVHDGNAKFILHSCGDLREIFADLVEMGIDGVQALQPKYNDLKMYREKYPKFALLGTIDDSDVLKYESPEFIRSSVKENIKLLGKKGGYVPGPTNFLLDQPPENVVVLFKAIQEFGKY